MKPRILITAILLTLCLAQGYGQEKSRKQLKEEENRKNQEAIAELITNKAFIFVAQWAYPAGGSMVDLRSNPNYIRFSPELLEGSMPFFGQGYSGIGLGGEYGIKFKDMPMEYKIIPNKKYFVVEARVKGTNDVYRLSLNITSEGRSDLSVLSNNRSSIRYSGIILSPEEYQK